MIFSKNSALHIFAGALSALVILFGISYTTRAVEAGPDWIGGAVTFESAGDYAYQDGDQYYMLANILSETVTAQVNDGSLLKPKLRDSTYGAYPTSVGYFDGYRALPIGETRWQTITRGDYRNAVFFGNPADAGALVFINSATPFYTGPLSLHYVADWRTMFGKLTANYQGNVGRSVSPNFDIDSTPVLKKPDGSVLPIRTTAAPAFSKNGQWLYLNSDVGQIRAHIPDLSYEIVGPHLADTYGIKSAASNDGRFIAAGSKNNKLTIYDTADCTANVCAKRELLTAAKAEYVKTLPSGVSLGAFDVVGVKFMGSAKLEAYFWTSWSDGTAKYIKAYVSVDAGAQPVRYLALGDSFSSGEGVYNYRTATDFYVDDDNYNICHQSLSSYPYLLNNILSPNWFGSVACSGAVQADVSDTEDAYLFSKPQAKMENISPQNVVNIKSNLIPGYVPQASFTAQYTPTIATISLGGNDIGFGDIVTACIINKFFRGFESCNTDRFDREQVANSIDAEIPRLAATFRSIKQNLGGDQKLYVIGYPKIVNYTNMLCSLNTPMNQSEREFADHLVDYLNEAVRIAASQAGARFLDMSSAFINSDHDYRLCGDDVYKAVNGIITAHDSSRKAGDLVAHESFHPNKLGHSLLAQQIRLLSNDFSFAMPEPVSTSTVPGSRFRIALVGDDVITNPNQNVNYITDAIPYILKDIGVQTLTFVTDSAGAIVQDVSASVELHSTPIAIGQATVKPDGTVTATFEIPDTVSPGYHQLHILYADSTGQSHDLYKYVLVAADINDYDGDGIPNDKEVCVVGDGAGIDSDHDGIDDACDGEYVMAVAAKADDDSSSASDSAVNVSDSSIIAKTEDTRQISGVEQSSDYQFITHPGAGLDIASTLGSVAIEPSMTVVSDNIKEKDDGWLVMFASILFILIVTVLGLRYRTTQKH